MTGHIDTERHPVADREYVERCRRELAADGVLVLQSFFAPEAVRAVVAESGHRSDEAYYASSTHNVYLTNPDPSLPDDHPFNRQVTSSKGLLADDELPAGSPLRDVYGNDVFLTFLRNVLGVDELHPYGDRLSSINVHFAAEGQELGWHFDNSSFAVTMLLREPESGGVFEYVRNARAAASGDMGYENVTAVLDGQHQPDRLEMAAGDLVLFRGRDALHRVTPTEGSVTRMLVVFAYNDEPGIALSDSALRTFYGRTA